VWIWRVTTRGCPRNVTYWHTTIRWCYVSSCTSLDIIIIISDSLITFTKCYRHDGHMAHLICHFVQFDSFQWKNRYISFHICQLFHTLRVLTCSAGLYLIPNELSCKGVYFPLYWKCHFFIIRDNGLREIVLDIPFRAKYFHSNLPPRRRICLPLACAISMLQEFVCFNLF